MRPGMMKKNALEETIEGAASSTEASSFAGAKSFACAASIAAVLLSGCNVGPKYVKPTAPAPPEFKESSPTAYSNAPAAGVWQPAQPQDAALKGKWWEVFNEPELNALEDQLDINNQNIVVSFQNFMAARAQVSEAKSQFYPTLTTAPSYTRQRTPGTLRDAVATTSASGGTGAVSTAGAQRRRIYRYPLTCRGNRTCGARFATPCVSFSMQRR
jgi:hypothetical protein